MPRDRESLLAGLSRCNLKGAAITVGKLLAATMPDDTAVEEIALAAMREIFADRMYGFRRGLSAARQRRTKHRRGIA